MTAAIWHVLKTIAFKWPPFATQSVLTQQIRRSGSIAPFDTQPVLGTSLIL